ncbi:MAG: helix-turn-helix transcriptional regulator [Treponema sp.]|nr:helix-turn-helix transcriptional regulator [Treponema sp.]
MLKNSEWNTINTILLDLYSLSEEKEIASKVLSVLRLLIPFSKGYFIFLDENEKINMEESIFLGFDEKSKSEYVETYYEKDYLKYLYSFNTDSSVYKDSAMLEDEIRKETDFYKSFMEPSGIPFGAGIVLVKNNQVFAVFNLFRSSTLGDFSDKDMYVLNILKKHLENMLSKIIFQKKSSQTGEEVFTRAVENFSLSAREIDVLKLLADGRSNIDISELINVSVSTVKKHVYNIFNKVGVNSRTQLLNMIYAR